MQELAEQNLRNAKAVSPDLQWLVVSAADAADWIGDVRSNPQAYRIKDGKVEARPEAWVVRSNPVSAVGDSAVFTVDFASEPVEGAKIQITRKTDTGNVIEEHDAPLSLEFDEVGMFHLQPVSAKHYCLITTVVIQ